ncbi:MAG: alpha-2-macroglobulin family protein [Candidatus Riflebacteria bacterium]|nr:alpha-2-macroglobulin family protein [Candidatus Riflebacteria bacterium]
MKSNRIMLLFLAVFCVLVLSGNGRAAEKVKLISPVEVESYYNNPNDRGVFLYLNEEVTSASLKRHIRFKPTAGFFNVSSIYKPNKHCYKISGKFVSDANYVLELLPGKNESGSSLQFAEAKIEFKAKGAKPEFRFIADRSVIELKSKQLLPISFTSTGDFRCELVNVPPFFAPALEGYTIFAEADELRPTSTESVKANVDANENNKTQVASISEVIKEMQKRFDLLNNFQDTPSVPELEAFIKNPFSFASKGYLGSQGKEDELMFSLPLDYRKAPENGGAVLIKLLENNESKAQEAVRLVQVTDLSITYKFSAKSMLLWVTSIETGKPVAGASIMLITKNNRYAFPGKTNKDGILNFKTNDNLRQIYFEEENYKFVQEPVAMSDLIMASVVTENDSSFIKLNSNRIYPSNVQQMAVDEANFVEKRGQIFCERGVYRPGEEVYWKAVFRQYDNGVIKTPTATDAVIIINNARGEEVYKKTHALSEFGSCNGTFNLTSYAQTGQYQIIGYIPENASGTNVTLNPEWDLLMKRKSSERSVEQHKEPYESTSYCTKSFQVQEFEAPRHFGEITFTTAKRKIQHIVGQEKEQDFVKFKIKGKYYAGGNLRHAKVQWAAHMVGHKTKLIQRPEYYFGNDMSDKTLIESGNTILDKDGTVEIELLLSQSVITGLNAIEMTATILDVDGKAATVVKTYQPQPSFRVGISDVSGPDKDGMSLVKTIAIDKNGNPLGEGKITLELMTNKWFYTQKRSNNGSVYYSWSNAWVRQVLLTANTNYGEASFNISLNKSESYIIKATYSDGINTSSSAREVAPAGGLSSYVDYNNQNRTDSGNGLLLTADKNEAKTDDKITIKYTLPRACSYALVTCENNEILYARVIKTDKSYGEFTETMTKACQPNVYVGITAPALRSEFPLYSGNVDTDYPRTLYGYTKIAVCNEQTKLNIAIEENEKNLIKAMPGQMKKLQFKVQDAQGAAVESELAICVADESILALTGFATPVLSALKNFTIPLSVFMGDLRVSLISQDLFKLISTRALTGGGEGSGEVVSESDLREDFRPVAYWNGALKTDSEGKAEIEFKVPDTMTLYRIYAVAIDKNSGFASNERPMQVSRDFYVEPGVMAFMTEGDKAVISLTYQNKTDQSGEASARIESMQNITAVLKDEKVNLEKFSNTTSKIELEADSDFNEATLLISANFNGMKDSVKRVIPINTAHIMINRQKSGAFKQNIEVKPEFPEWLDNDIIQTNVNGRISLSCGLWARLAPTLNYLMTYPYGCAEQVSSGLIPLAALRTLAETDKLPGYKAEDFDIYIRNGLEKLYKMQHGSGGFAYWSSMSHESWWSSQYVIFAISILKRAGYEVDESRLAKALDYVDSGLFKNEQENRFSHGIMALAAVNLAMNNRLKAADTDKVLKKFSNINDEGAAMSIWAETMLKRIPNDSLEAIISKLEPSNKSVSKGWYSSTVRTDAIKLMICLEHDGKVAKAKAAEFAGALLKNLNQKGYWNSTADTGIGLLALAEYMRKEQDKTTENSKVKVTTINGTKEYDVNFAGIEIELTGAEMSAKEGIQITSLDNVLVNWSLHYSYPDDPSRKESIANGFTIEKSFENISGSNTIKVGDIVKATITFEDKFSESNDWRELSNLAIEDWIPAGFIPINTALKNDALPADISPEEEQYYYDMDDGAYTFYADHQEIRKDRFLAFKNRSWSGKFKIEYYMRASYPGSFMMKPAQVSLMYAPEIYGRTAPTVINIEE